MLGQCAKVVMLLAAVSTTAACVSGDASPTGTVDPLDMVSVTRDADPVALEEQGPEDGGRVEATQTASSTPSVTPSPTATMTAAPTASILSTATATNTATRTPESTQLEIVELTLNDIDDTPLRHVSVDEHPYFGGYTHVHGTLAVTGDNELADVILEVVAPDNVVVSASLAEPARDLLLQPFGDDEWVEITASQLLFAIPSTAFEPIDKSRSGWLSLRVRARSNDGREAVRTYGWVSKLVRYRSDNRFYIGEEHQGGNDWVTPDVRTLLTQFDGVLIGDISNMNGGPFPPHMSHQDGTDADLWFPGYDALDGTAANVVLQLIDRTGIVEQICCIFVAYQPVEGDPFWAVIKDVTLLDGRAASEVIIPDADHWNHFHLRVRS